MNPAAPAAVDWAAPSAAPVRMDCPNCGEPGDKPARLTVHFDHPGWPLGQARVVCCPGCSCLFYEHQQQVDYAEAALLHGGRVAFYVQQGAGLSLITRPLARLRRPAGSAYLEVGCGFGFGLDFAVRSLGWIGQGIDPGAIAQAGADMLGVAIRQAYLAADAGALAGSQDVVFAAETIEHVGSPRDFVRTLRRMLRPGGVLALTTPDAGEIDRSASSGKLVALLFPGQHLILQTRDSLERLLREAGFSHVAIEKDGNSLVAYACDAAIALEDDPAALQRRYVDYLDRRRADFPPAHDLFLGLTGRMLLEAVNAADLEAADRAWAGLRAPVRQRFGLELDTLRAVPPEAATCALERLADFMPLNLGCVLYADAIRRLLRGAPRRGLEPRFIAAAAACAALRRAVAALATDDGLSEDIGWTAAAEAVLCAASRGAPDIVARVASLPPAPNHDMRRRDGFVLRAVIELAQAGHDGLARQLAIANGLDAPGCDPWSALPTPLRRAFQAVARRLGLPIATPLAGAEAERRLIALVDAGDYEAAALLAEALNHGPYAMPPRVLSPAQSATLAALAALDARPGGAAPRARVRFTAVRTACETAAPAHVPDLFWTALQGEQDMTALLDGPAEARRLRAAVLGRLGLQDAARG